MLYVFKKKKHYENVHLKILFDADAETNMARLVSDPLCICNKHAMTLCNK